jgi:hypothetical protein
MGCGVFVFDLSSAQRPIEQDLEVVAPYICTLATD